MLRLSVCVLFITFSLTAQAMTVRLAPQKPDSSLSVRVTQFLPAPLKSRVVDPDLSSDCSGGSLSPFTIGWDDILTIGKTLWQIVQAGQPTETMHSTTVSALPRGLSCWTSLDSWQNPRSETFIASYTNWMGLNVVETAFQVQYTYGGGHNGIGHYLANVTVVPANISVLWGYKFDADVDVDQAVNVGSSTDPIAGLQLNIKWTISSIIKTETNDIQVFVRGDGQ